MADSKETIKSNFTAPTHRVVDGVKVDLTSEQADKILDEWTDNEHARQVDEDANGYKFKRQDEYPSIEDQLDYIYHNGLTKWKSDIIKPIKDKHPKP